MKPINQKYTINASARKIWNALTNPKRIDEWGGGPSKMKEEVGFRFSFWKGSIFGKNIEVVKNKLLVQEWYAGRWDKPSIITFKLEEKEGVTKVTLNHIDVPDEEREEISKGWKIYYMNPIKDLVEKN